jgi:hypothetical protein
MEYYYQKQVLPAGKSISDAAGDCFQSQGRTGGHGQGGGSGGDWRWWKTSCRKKGMLILLVISHLYDQLLDLHPLAEYCYCCPIVSHIVESWENGGRRGH